MSRSLLLLILLVGIGVAIYARKRKDDVNPINVPNPEPSADSPCTYYWEDKCSEICHKTFRIDTPGMIRCADATTGKWYNKDEEVPCHLFDTKILGTWVTKNKTSGHFFLITIKVDTKACNSLMATCSFFNGDEGGVLAESTSLNSMDSSVVYTNDRIIYTLPGPVQELLAKSKKFKEPIGTEIVLNWKASGYWMSPGLSMTDDTNFGTLNKSETTVTDLVETTYKSVASPSTVTADQDVEIVLSKNEATVTIISDNEPQSVTAPFVYSGLTSNDIQLIKMDQKMRNLLRKITTRKQNIAAFNAALLEMTENAIVVLRNTRTGARTTLPPQKWGYFGYTGERWSDGKKKYGFLNRPPMDASGMIDLNAYPDWKTYF